MKKIAVAARDTKRRLENPWTEAQKANEQCRVYEGE
jgi:hypothetical protein